MSMLTVTAKGQVTLSKDVLKHLGVHPGEKITVDKLPDGRIEMKAVRPTGKISDAFDFLKRRNGPSLSIEEMNTITVRAGRARPAIFATTRVSATPVSAEPSSLHPCRESIKRTSEP